LCDIKCQNLLPIPALERNHAIAKIKTHAVAIGNAPNGIESEKPLGPSPINAKAAGNPWEPCGVPNAIVGVIAIARSND